eukprot:Skav235144  [mRNA]  locus=scaffold1072:78768:88405:- [translate_table: standard]
MIDEDSGKSPTWSPDVQHEASFIGDADDLSFSWCRFQSKGDESCNVLQFLACDRTWIGFDPASQGATNMKHGTRIDETRVHAKCVSHSHSVDPTCHGTFAHETSTRHRSAFKGSRTHFVAQEVKFHRDVMLICFSANRRQHITASLADVHAQCRTLWHLDGQVCDEPTFFMALVNWTCGIVPVSVWGNDHSSLRLGCGSCLTREPVPSQFDRSRHLRSTFDVRLDFHWEVVRSLCEARSHCRRVFFETWFVAQDRIPICIRSRRFHTPPGVDRQTFEQMCISMWTDMLVPHQHLRISIVHPNPVTFPTTIVHVVIQQGGLHDSAGILFRSDIFTTVEKHRALLIPHRANVRQIFNVAQFDCTLPLRNCRIDCATQPPATFSAFEVPPLVPGQLVSGELGHDGNPSDDSDSDGDAGSASATTEAPPSNDITPLTSEDEAWPDMASLTQTAHHLVPLADTNQGSWDTSRATPTGCQEDHFRSHPGSDALSWYEIPIDYKISDVLATRQTPSWIEHSSSDELVEHFMQEEDVISLMQRNRSRSRSDLDRHEGHSSSEGAEDASDVPQSDEEPTEDELDPVTWQIVYSYMPDEPPIVAADPRGPTPSQASIAAGLPSREGLAVYPVHALTDNQLDFIALLDCRGDHVHHATEAVVLFQICCQDQSYANEHEGRPRIYLSHHIARNLQSYNTFVGTMQLTRLAERFPHLVVLRHNHHVWAPNDESMRRLAHGDLLEVHVAEDTDPAFQVALIDWLMSQGLTPWPALLEVVDSEAPSPTLPFEVDAMVAPMCQPDDNIIPGHGFNTWYISERHPVCSDSRLILFGSSPNDWRPAIERIWYDRFQAGQPYSITWVVPHPPPTGHHGTDFFPHLIIEQEPRLGSASLHFTIERPDPGLLVPSQVVASVGADAMPRAHFALLGIDALCQARFDCQVYHAGVRLDLDTSVRRVTGQALHIRMSPREHDASEPHDLHSMMQQPHLGSQALPGYTMTHAGTGETEHGYEMQMPPEPAIPCTGSQVYIESQPSDIQSTRDMHTMLDAFSTTTTQEGAQEQLIATYFLSPLTMQTCAFPRYVRISTREELWRRTFTEVWMDVLDPAALLEWFTVMPPPLQSSSGPAPTDPVAFVLVVQHRSQHAVPTLITLIEEPDFLHVAKIMPAAVTQRQVIASVGMGKRCFGARADSWCTVGHGFATIPHDPPYPLAAGMGLCVAIFPLEPDAQIRWHEELQRERALLPNDQYLWSAYHESREDALQLLQLSGQLWQLPRCKRTTTLVPTDNEQGRASQPKAPSVRMVPQLDDHSCGSYTEVNPGLRSGSSGVPHMPSLAQTDQLRDAVGHLHQHSGPTLCQHWPHLPELHAAAAWATEITPQFTDAHPDEIHVYTDGTAATGTAAWALVVLAAYHSPGGVHFEKIGYAGRVLDETIGSFLPNALDAEATALIALSELVLNGSIPAAPHLICHCDSTSASQGAFGFQDIPSCQGEVSPRQTLARNMVHLLQQTHHVSLRHIHSHEGHPWNEFADSLAYHFRCGWTPVVPYLHSSDKLAAHPMRNWAWLFLASSADMPTLPQLLQNATPHSETVMPDATLNEPLPMELLHVHKLRLCAQLLKIGDDFAHQALLVNHRVAGERSWISSLHRSVLWLCEQIGSDSLPPELLRMDVPEHWSLLQPFARALKKHIQAGLRAHQLRIQTLLALQSHAQFQDELLTDLNWQSSQRVEISVPEHRCAECDASFESHASLAVHQSSKHGARIAVRRFAPDAACRICKRWYHTRARAVLHLQSSSTNCWIPMMRQFEPMSLDQTRALDEQDRLAKQAHHQRGLRSAEEDKVWRLATLGELCPALCPKPQAPSDMTAEATPEELVEWSRYGLLPPGRGGRPLTRRHPVDHRVFNIMAELRGWEDVRLQTARMWNPCFDWVPRPFSTGEAFALILFSGHRRDGDIATWLAHYGQLTPICVDLAIHETAGNVMHDEPWTQLIRARRVKAAHAGPPCETYTLARWLEIPGEKGPRPLRSATYPWGLPDRKEKEVRQCHFGTVLMLKALQLLLLTWSYGGAITLEHPKGPYGDADTDPYWCIWFSSFVRQWLLAPEIQTVTFLQGPLGQVSPKPTTLLVGRLPDLPARIYSSYQRGWRPAQYLGGRTDSGAWKTAKAKEYPVTMCRILAAEFSSFAQMRPTDTEEAVPAHVQGLIQQLSAWDPYMTDSAAGLMGADYQPAVYR